MEPCGISGSWICTCQLRQLSLGVRLGHIPLSHWDGEFDIKSLLSGSSPNDGSPQPSSPTGVTSQQEI